MTDESRKASEHLGPHLLGRKPSPADDRDYKVSNYLKRTTEPADSTWLERPIKDLIGTTWKFFLTIWALIKQHKPPPEPPSPSPAPDVEWLDQSQLDQGQTGHCVGFGHAQFGNTAPVEDQFKNSDGHAIYYEAKQIEVGPDVKVVPGESQFEDGTYVRAGAKTLQNRGLIRTYAFAHTTEEMIDALHQFGPVIVGTTWTNDMFDPDAKGLVRPTGGSAGGHCYLAVGYFGTKFSAPVFKFQNSWGDSWGENGYFYMYVSDFEKLLADNGEAEVTVEVAR